MKALVTGGAGFIGSHLVDLLVSEGYEIDVLDDFSSGREENLADALASGKVTIFQDDIRSFDFNTHFAERPTDVIFHLAAQIDVRKSVEAPEEDCETNVVATVRIANAARKHSVRKIIHTSSGGSIYGSPESFPVDESFDVMPESPYAASKAAGELYLSMFCRLYPTMRCAFIAPANVYGPRQNPDGEAGVVAIFAERLLKGQPTKVFGNGGNTRDYVYVKDVARAFYLAWLHAENGERFNIGTGVETSDRELHTMVASATSAVDQPEFAPARLGDVPRSCLASRKAEQQLGWSAEVPIEEGIRATVDFFRG